MPKGRTRCTRYFTATTDFSRDVDPLLSSHEASRQAASPSQFFAASSRDYGEFGAIPLGLGTDS